MPLARDVVARAMGREYRSRRSLSRMKLAGVRVRVEVGDPLRVERIDDAVLAAARLLDLRALEQPLDGGAGRALLQLESSEHPGAIRGAAAGHDRAERLLLDVGAIPAPGRVELGPELGDRGGVG